MPPGGGNGCWATPRPWRVVAAPPLCGSDVGRTLLFTSGSCSAARRAAHAISVKKANDHSSAATAAATSPLVVARSAPMVVPTAAAVSTWMAS